jgi:non-canonical poly(A) RNA polymerase PAPD5/7
MVNNLAAIVRRRWPDARLYPFGSFMSGLYLPTADMDIAICSERFANGGRPMYNAKNSLYALRAWLNQHRVAYRNEIEVIAKAKVPLIKFADMATALKVDISFEKLDGHRAIQTFLDWRDRYPAMPKLVAVVKHFLQMRGLNEPVNGGIGGFSVICMVVHLLNMLPDVQSGSLTPEHELGRLLMEFLDYYGNHFNYQTVAIRMNPPGIVNKVGQY